MERIVEDIPEMYMEVMTLLRHNGVEASSRNGPVIYIPEPVTITVNDPEMRVLNDPIRQANPFFHVLEFVWMMSSSRDPAWVAQFNKRMFEYADLNNATGELKIHGAYGYRWRQHFAIDQLIQVVDLIRDDNDTRRAVIGMWDPMVDFEPHADLPCNTHIYLSNNEGSLDMTVCNRSNDAIWGMCGANAVHLTLLHELLALELGGVVGKYRVFTNNLHVYKELPWVKEMLNTTGVYYPPMGESVPLLRTGETMEEFMGDCELFVAGEFGSIRNYWLNHVAEPINELWFNRNPDKVEIRDSNWQFSCMNWLQLKAR